MRAAPSFWEEPAGVLANLLLPIGAAWDSVGRLRRALAHPYCPPVPVICIGNLVAGGAGKTPVALAVAAFLADCGIKVHIVTRGYGGRVRGPIRVDLSRHDASAVGDEPLLLAARMPCWVARDRPAGVRDAVVDGADIILLDDGFQNPTVAKTLSLLVIDTAYGFGNCRVMPSGPLREGIDRGLARADALVLLGETAEASGAGRLAIDRKMPALRAFLVPIAPERFAGTRVFAFAGIGRPEKFFASLRSLGAELVGTRAFPDHHPFRDAQIAELRRAAEQTQARLVTTAKDIVRVPAASRAGIEVFDVEIRWSDPAALRDVLRPIVSAASDGRRSVDWRD